MRRIKFLIKVQLCRTLIPLPAPQRRRGAITAVAALLEKPPSQAASFWSPYLLPWRNTGRLRFIMLRKMVNYGRAKAQERGIARPVLEGITGRTIHEEKTWKG